VIITDFGDTKKWVEDGINGFIIPLKDHKTLAERIVYLLRNEAVRIEFGKRGRKIIEERNDWQKEMRKIEELYESLMIRSKK
jgi:glycosyltransferase involved in cell wall biosynthesis